MKKKGRGKLTKGPLFLQENAKVHTAQLSVTTAANCSFELLFHQPYLPELAPLDYHLPFPNMNKIRRGKKCMSIDDVKDHIIAFLKEQQLNNSHTKT